MNNLKIGDRVKIINHPDRYHIIKQFHNKKPSVLITYGDDSTWWPLNELQKIDNQLDLFNDHNISEVV